MRRTPDESARGGGRPGLTQLGRTPLGGSGMLQTNLDSFGQVFCSKCRSRLLPVVGSQPEVEPGGDMSVTVDSRSASADGSSTSKAFTWSLCVLALVTGTYFVLTNVPQYFIWSETTYGFYWPRAGFLLMHIVGGLVAIVIGPFQFSRRIRTTYPKVHRISGRIYLVSIVIGALGGLIMAATTTRGYASGLFTLALAWLLTSGMAFVAIRKRNFIQHQQWMIRSYVVTFAFVTYRLALDSMTALEIGQQGQRGMIISWACWAVPLLITELVIQGKQVFAVRPQLK
jgi:hypothetical protein